MLIYYERPWLKAYQTVLVISLVFCPILISSRASGVWQSRWRYVGECLYWVNRQDDKDGEAATHFACYFWAWCTHLRLEEMSMPRMVRWSTLLSVWPLKVKSLGKGRPAAVRHVAVISTTLHFAGPNNMQLTSAQVAARSRSDCSCSLTSSTVLPKAKTVTSSA